MNTEKYCLFCLEPVTHTHNNPYGCECTLTYHSECINNWNRRARYCPICRYTPPVDDATGDYYFRFITCFVCTYFFGLAGMLYFLFLS